jgi:hypothetical protein
VVGMYVYVCEEDLTSSVGVLMYVCQSSLNCLIFFWIEALSKRKRIGSGKRRRWENRRVEERKKKEREKEEEGEGDGLHT